MKSMTSDRQRSTSRVLVQVVSTVDKRKQLPTLEFLADLPGCGLDEGAPAYVKADAMEVVVDLYEINAPQRTAQRIEFRGHGLYAGLMPQWYPGALDATLREMGRGETWHPLRLAVSWLANAQILTRMFDNGTERPAVFFPTGVSYIDLDGVRVEPSGPDDDPYRSARIVDYEAASRPMALHVTGSSAMLRGMMDTYWLRKAPFTV